MTKKRIEFRFIKRSFSSIFVLCAIFLHTHIQAQTVYTLAGSGIKGSSNGTGSSAEFNYPIGIALDGAGNTYVADSYNNQIRKISATGVVTTLAGYVSPGSTNGTGIYASFDNPAGIVVDKQGNVYVADRNNNQIRKISAAGVVTTLAGSLTPGSSDGQGSLASFYSPSGVALDKSGNIYVADYNNNKIRKISPTGIVTTLAGSGFMGSDDGIGTDASFNRPFSLAVDGSNNVYVTCFSGFTIRKITPAGFVTTLTYSAFSGYLGALCIDGLGNLYVTENGPWCSKIFKITTNGVISHFAGTGKPGSNDGPALSASFSDNYGITANSSGELVYVSDFLNNKIRKIESCFSSVPNAPLANITQPSSSKPTGTITITSPIGAFEYSIDHINYQTSTIFSGLQPGSFQLTARKISSTTCISLPTNITINSAPIPPVNASIAAGGRHTLSICNDGTVMAWGDNTDGQLGIGNTTYQSKVPVKINSLADITSIAAGSAHSLAIKNNSTVWSWGLNIDGQLGQGNNTPRIYVPAQVNGLVNINAISAGTKFSLALKNDGTVWAWGDNNYYQFGNGKSTSSNIPVQLNTISSIAAIAAGHNHSLALKNDGTVWAWGSNYYGQLGNGTDGQFTDSKVPTQVNFLTGIIAIAAGNSHSLALSNDGTVWSWGWNSFGELGIGIGNPNKLSNVPIQVSSLTNIIAISAGEYTSLALKSDGSVWSWGSNLFGQLGIGSNTNSNIPVQVSSISGIISIKGGGVHSLALKNNGALYSWGLNGYASLGTGTNTDSNVPISVNNLCSNLLGIEDLSTEHSIPIYPNPSNGIFQLTLENLQYGKANLQIYNMLGKMIYEATTEKKQIEIDLSALSKGIYLVKVYKATKTYMQKIIIE
jgi:alpha-tubulin suppressor-like RCC1 family protein/streptogramin lyase